MRYFHDPTPILRRTPAPAFLSRDPRGVPMGSDCFLGRLSVVAFIRIQKKLPSLGKRDDSGVEYFGKLADVMSMSPGNDQRQRDATGVHQDVPFASLFFPDPSGSGRSLLAPGAL